MATTDKWKDKASGEMKEQTEWHRISFFGRLAEIAGEYLKKGSPVYIEGRIRTRKWQDKEGQDRYSTEIVADRMQLLGSRGGAGGGGDSMPREAREPRGGGESSGGAKPAANKGGGASFDDMDDDIPF